MPSQRVEAAVEIAHSAGELAMGYFNDLASLAVERKGHQDFVSSADRAVEIHIREALLAAFTDDAIVGEEHAPTPGSSGFTWVIDPIDGTTNFVNGIPAWAVVLAGVRAGRTEIAVIHDPVHLDTYVAERGQGAFLNDTRLRLTPVNGLQDGSVGVGFSNRTDSAGVLKLITNLLAEGGLFQRNGSGALSLAYVAAGRLIGYAEQHMNAWDCLAGQLLVAEAGGCIEEQDADAMIRDGGRVIAANASVFDQFQVLCEDAFGA